MGWQDEEQIINLLNQVLSGQQAILQTAQQLQASHKTCCAQLNGKLNKILANLISPAVSFVATITLNTQGESEMATAKATADLQVTDTGTFTVTLSFADADGVATAEPAGLTATYTASDATPGPSALTLVTPGASGDTSTAAGSINQATIQADVAAGTPLPTGLTVSVTASWTGLAAPLTVTAAPALDVVAGPASTFIAAATTP